MLKAGASTEWTCDFYRYITDGEVREAFALLVGSLACAEGVTCARRDQGEVRSVGIEVDGECWFALMVAREWLTFQWRPPVTRTNQYRSAHLRSQFPDSFTDTAQADHWSIKITSLDDALRLLLILDIDTP